MITIPCESVDVEARDRAEADEARVGSPAGGRRPVVVGDTSVQEPSQQLPSAAVLPSAGAGVPASVSAHSATATHAERRTGEFRFVVPGEPTPWARAGGGKSVVRFTPAKQRNYMGAVKLFCSAAMQGVSPLDGPIAISVNAVYAWPASWNAKRRAQPNARWKISRPDLDNCSLKLLADALNTVAWTDDARICMAILRKYYGDFPQLEVSIRGL